MIKSLFKLIKNKFLTVENKLKYRLKKYKAVDYAHDTIIELGGGVDIDDAIIRTGRFNKYTPEEIANFIIMLEDFIKSDLLIWQQNKTNGECQDLLVSFVHYLEAGREN
mgnify:FL=1